MTFDIPELLNIPSLVKTNPFAHMIDWFTYGYQLNELEAVPEKVLITMEEEYDKYLDRICDGVGLPE